MTTLYFVRHAQSDYTIHDDQTRPLTAKGLQDRTLVSDYLMDKDVSVVISSPYKRAYDTVAEFAQRKELDIICVDDLRERKIEDEWIDDFTTFTMNQWSDFNYKRSSGESLKEVQTRNIHAILELLDCYPDKTIAIGTHGTALSTIINYFDPSFTYENFAQIVSLMPWIVRFTFHEHTCTSIEFIDVLNQ